MTTIAYRDGVMVADSMAYCGRGSASLGTKVKARRMEDGTLVGASSAVVGAGDMLLDWYANGRPDLQDIPENFTILVIRPDRKALLYRDSIHPTGPLKAPFFAIGSGEDFALGAMEAGAGARQAVKIAARFDPHTNAKLVSLTH